MALLKTYDIEGKQVGEMEIDDELLKPRANTQLIKDYLVALRANQRQWKASTQTRAEVNHSGKKPHPQKGTGRARQGYLGAPQYRGGGRVHAPRPKFDQHQRVNRQERRAAIHDLLAERIREDRMHLLSPGKWDLPKTQRFLKFLRSLKLEGERVLVLGEGGIAHQFIQQSVRNLPRVEFQHLPNVNGYELALHRQIILLDGAKEMLLKLLQGQAATSDEKSKAKAKIKAPVVSAKKAVEKPARVAAPKKTVKAKEEVEEKPAAKAKKAPAKPKTKKKEGKE